VSPRNVSDGKSSVLLKHDLDDLLDVGLGEDESALRAWMRGLKSGEILHKSGIENASRGIESRSKESNWSRRISRLGRRNPTSLGHQSGEKIGSR